MPHCRNVCLRHNVIHSFKHMTLTFESLTLKTCTAIPTHMMNICGKFLSPLSTEIPRHAK